MPFLPQLPDRPALRLLVAALASPLAPAWAAPAAPALPTQLVCKPDVNHVFSVSRYAVGTPLAVSASVSAGTRDCDFASTGSPTALPGGAWRFEWDDETLGQRQRVDVSRAGADGYTVAFNPATCGALRLPASVALSPSGRGCAVSVDRDGAFVQFWQQLRDALARRDGDLLQRLSLPQLEFVDGPDIVKAPSSIMRTAARCLPGVPATTKALDLGEILRSAEAPRLDMPPLSRRGDARIDFAGAMSLTWTPQGWRMDGFNASPGVFSRCETR
ncbi:hypothetical protein [Pelomonas cellulosilytica]|uniref:Uncharacterized protein n=1 Tax=Pelomonas cellulosilytica TaxID=2906762 RepID=A0ABS8XXC3_9BURK|nr:hypothetical protein [Pelomonas sp. P8]MCE4555918.1 hypothetical protein [Pelomonas sp. P8]